MAKKGCVLHRGYVQSNGYGVAYSRRLKNNTTAHRVAWEAVHGPIPKGLEIDHLCRVKRCVNVNHMELVIHSENVRRQKASRPRRKAKCKRGHWLRGFNVMNFKRGRHDSRRSRRCRACHNIRQRAYYRRKVSS